MATAASMTNLYLCMPKLKRTSSLNSSVQGNRRNNQISSVATTLIKNYNSLYDNNKTCNEDDYYPPTEEAPEVDFAAISASQRFFFSSPGNSNSIIDSSPPEINGDQLLAVAVETNSRDPYMDFRHSMKEMVEAREMGDVSKECEYLQQLLFRYLALNQKSTHKFILRAFADLVVTLSSKSSMTS